MTVRPARRPTRKGPAFVRKQTDASLALAPDLEFVNERMVAEGDLVAIHWTATGNSVPRLALLRQLGFTITPPKAE